MKQTTASTTRSSLLVLAGLILLVPSAWGQTASLVRDINTNRESPASSSPEQMLTVGDRIFFTAFQAGSGQELWVSDGSGTGTQMLSDICPGDCESRPVLLGGTGGVLIFTVTVPNGQGRREVWRSDGTRKGTFALRSSSSEPIYSAGFDEADGASIAGALLFSGCTADFECQLWRTDGTPAGTQPLKEVDASDLVTAGGKAYFFSESALWVSDGTAAGTQRLSEHSFGFSPRFLTPATNRVFFLMNDGDDGGELWTSDGTAAGTRALTSFPNDRPFDNGAGLKVVGNHVYFLADDVIHGLEIWRSDGTPETTRRITEFGFHAPLNSGSIFQMEELGGRLLFAATDGLNPRSLWTTTGTPESTAPLQCAGGCPELSANRLVKVGGRVLFSGTDEDHGRELWSTDGTAAGTKLIKDVCLGSCDGLIQEPTLFLGASYFIARIDDVSSVSSIELWTSDGTPAGTRRFADPASGFQPVQDDSLEIAALGSTLFLQGFNGYGIELWASDGNPGGTRLVDDLARNASGSDPQNLVALADRLLFTACDGNNRNLWKSAGTPEATTQVTAAFTGCFSFGPPQNLTVAGPLVYFWVRDPDPVLWRTDGTAAGTLQLAEIEFGGTELIALGGRIFFVRSANDAFTRWEMWQSDGTPAGTRKAFDLPLDAGQPIALTALGSEMYFVGRSVSGPDSLWRSDGTLAGTLRLKDGLNLETVAPRFTRVGSNVFFIADDDSSGRALWKTNGTGAGTVRVRGDFPGFSNSLSDLTAFQGNLYFVVGDFLSSPENRTLWRSNGTEAGTVPVLAFPGENPFDSTAFGLTVFNDRLYFAADDGVHGRELWTSDGTTAGTTLVRDVRPGPIGSRPSGFTAAGGRLFFSAGDADHGFEPWQSDGTEAGTRLLQDLAPYGTSSDPELFTVAGGYLYFTADDRLSGHELWALPLSGSGCQPSATSLCLNGGRFKVEAQWRDFQGNTGSGHAVALTADTGYFWFFGPANVEVILKVLDGRGLNDHFWVFFGALSNVEYTLTVTDTATGATRRYFNPSGTFGSIGDTRGFGPLGAFSIADQAPAKHLLPLVAERTDAAAATGVCVPGPGRLCLNDGRFAVEAAWKDFAGQTGTGTAVPLSTDTGYFWFFNAANVEAVIKVLDGQAVNGRHWVFYGALSNVEYTLTVTDTMTGRIRTYTNPSGRFASIGDTQAF